MYAEPLPLLWKALRTSCAYCEAIDKDGVVCLKKGKRMFIPFRNAAVCYDYERKRRRLL